MTAQTQHLDAGRRRVRRELGRTATLTIRLGAGAAAIILLVGWIDLPEAVERRITLFLAWALLAAVTVAIGSAAHWITSLRAPAPDPASAGPGVHRLLAEHGHRDSLGYFALREDKTAIFSPSGKSAVCYRVVGGVSLAAGDPLGDPEAWPQAIAAWLDEARRNGWQPAVLGAGERAARTYARHGLSVLEIGDEAIVETAGFSLDGRAMRCVRQATGRIRRAGFTVRVRRGAELTAADAAELTARAGGWRCDSGERGFSMALGRIGGPADPGYVIAEAIGPDGVSHGVLGLVPWGPDGLSLDLMRRDKTSDRASDNGLVEFMVTELLARCPALGVARVSLNFAMFRSVFARAGRIGGGPVLRAWCGVLRLASRFWQVEQLYLANQKYRPVWTPRYLCFSSAARLPRVLAAAAAAEGFLTVRRPRVSHPARTRARELAAATHGNGGTTRELAGPARG
jgi:lysyl-tRNA synthetase class 2